jgi:hypothetical protein
VVDGLNERSINTINGMTPEIEQFMKELLVYCKAKRGRHVPQQLSDWLLGHRTPNAERILKIQEYLRSKKS